MFTSEFKFSTTRFWEQRQSEVCLITANKEGDDHQPILSDSSASEYPDHSGLLNTLDLTRSLIKLERGHHPTIPQLCHQPPLGDVSIQQLALFSHCP